MTPPLCVTYAVLKKFYFQDLFHYVYHTLLREGGEGLSTGALLWHPYTLVHMPTRQQYLQTCVQHGVGML